VFRLRRRGPALEAAVVEVLTPGGDQGQRRRLLRAVARASGADHLLMLGRPDWRTGFVPVPNLGPRLTTRALATAPPTDLAAWSFSLGDIELF
jgi:hypothetical protein